MQRDRLRFYTLPSKHLVSQNEACTPGFKVSKECLLELTYSNITGINEMAKTAKQKAFKNIKLNLIPVY